MQGLLDYDNVQLTFNTIKKAVQANAMFQLSAILIGHV